MTPEYIIIHHSLTDDGTVVNTQSIRRYHMNDLGWSAIGYHYLIERINNTVEIIKGRFDDQVGAHCKQNRMNYKSLGICCVGNFDEAPPDDIVWYKLVRLCRSLMHIHDIPWQHVHPHRLHATYKTCPGKMFDMDKLTDALRKGEQ